MQQDQYKNILEEFEKEKVEFPDIAVKNNCGYEHFFWRRNKVNFNQFKGVFEPISNKIIVCSNFLTNFMELKENLDREINMAYDFHIKKNKFQKDKEFAQSTIRSCHAQLKNYNWEEDLTKEMTKLCAKNLFKVFIFLIHALIFFIRQEARMKIGFHTTPGCVTQRY